MPIRGFRPDDWRDLHEYLSRPEVLEFEPSDPSDEVERRETAAERAQDDDFWAVCLIPSGKVIGHVSFARTGPAELMTWELGYIFNPLYSGQGYVTEPCRALLEHGYGELGAHRFVAICDPGNPPSWKLLERLSLRREGDFGGFAFFRRDEGGEPLWPDAYQYALLAEEWRALG